MSLTRLLILSCLLASLLSCRYGFVPEGSLAGKAIELEPTVNRTYLGEAGLVLDSQLERAFSDLGLLARKEAQQRLYRLTIRVHVRLSDTSGRIVWQETFSDRGAFSEGNQDEDALDEACRKISLQIARAVAALTP